MLQSFYKTIKEYGMLSPGDKVIVGLSGGADSVCLLYNLIELSKTMGFTVCAVHVNHGIRGAEADRDQEFCRKLCLMLNVDFYSEKCAVPEYAEKHRLSTEEAARELRYKILNKYSENGKIATAHNLSDNAETVIYNLIRGTGLKGLCGIPPVRDNIIRPLILTPRTEIEQYLKENNYTFVTDSSNLSTEYSRNKIRLMATPVFSRINPDFFRSVGRTTKILSDENNLIENLTENVYNKCIIQKNKLNADTLKCEHKALRSRCIGLFLENNGISKNFDRINTVEALLLQDGKINIQSNVYITSKRGIISIEHSNNSEIPFCEKLLKEGENYFFDKTISVRIINAKDFDKIENINKNFANYYADYVKIQGDVVLRSRRGGDKIKLEGRSFHSSLKKLLSASVPAAERGSKCILSDDSGVIFAEGFGFSECVRVESTTEKILAISIKGGSENY